MELRLLMAVGAVAAATAGSAFAGDSVTIDPIGWRQNGGANVPEGPTQTVTAPMDIGPGGTFVKAGAGTLEVPISALDKYHDGDVDPVVQGGTLKLTIDQVSTPALTAPACFDKSAHWFSAVNTDYIVSSNGDDTVWRWFDARETGVTGENTFVPTRPFMQYTCLKTDAPITLGSYRGFNAVYGGGKRTTGGYLEMRNAKNSATLVQQYVYAVFFVHGVKDSWGTLIGANSDPNDFFALNTSGARTVGDSGLQGYYYYRGDSLMGSFTARHYRNGMIFDPFHDYVTRTHEVIGANFVDRPTKFSHMFAHRNSNDGRFGGDYLYEVVVFTNRLTEVEVEEVNSYLVRKYGLEKEYRNLWTIGVAECGSVEITKACDSTTEAVVATNHLPILFKGEGTIVKTGSNTFSLRPMTFEDFNGVFKLAQGSVLSRFEEIIPLLPESGKQYTVEKPNVNTDLASGVSLDVRQGTKITVGTGTAGTVTKTGNGELSVVGIPEGTKKVEVNAGTLTLIPREAKKVYASGDAMSAVFADPGVENEQKDCPPSKDSSRRPKITPGNSFGGWTCPSTSDGTVGVAVAPLIYSGSSFNYEVAEGNQAITLLSPSGAGQTKSELYTTVNFPAAGLYRVSWREAQGSLGSKTRDSYAYHVMLGKTWAEAEEVDHRIAADGHYPRVYMLMNVPEAGDYCFGFRIDDNMGNGNYYNVTMDDFRADYVVKPQAANVVKIPNGDFEQVCTDPENYTLGAIARTYMGMDNYARGWIFHQGDSIGGTYPSVAVASPSIPQQTVQRNGGAINNNAVNTRFSRLADDTYGTFSLFMAYIKKGAVDRGGNNYATTTFTVEKAGTYYLRGKVSRWNVSYDGADFLGQDGQIPSIKATMTVGGAANELGALVGDRHLQQDRYWATPFTVAEDNTEVTLKIEQTVAGAAAIVDDLVLVKAVEGIADVSAERGKEYITNGSFEDGVTGKESYTATSWGTVAGQGTSGNISWWINIGNGLQYTTGAYDGIGACCVRSDSTLYQTLPAMKAGKYRFRVAANSRSNGQYGHNGFKVWLEKSGSDPVNICQIDHVHNGNPKVHYFDFEVPEDGVYTFKLQGTVAGQPAWALGTIACVVDGLSIKRVFDEEMVLPEVPANTKITVASGAKLKLDFDGTLDVGTVTLGGTKVYGGEVSKTTYPNFIEGDGKFNVTTSNKGMLLLIR